MTDRYEFPDLDKLGDIEVELELEDGTRKEFVLFALFYAGETPYAALIPNDNGDEGEVILLKVSVFEYDPDELEINLELKNIDDTSEYDRAAEEFAAMMADEDGVDVEFT